MNTVALATSDKSRLERSSMGCAQLVLWTFISTLAMFVGLITLLLFWALDLVRFFTMLTPILQIPVSAIATSIIGGIVGGSQALLLGNQTRWRSTWWYGTIIGWAMAGILWWTEFSALGGDKFSVVGMEVPVAILIASIIGGGAIGFGQWLVLHSQTGVSVWWIVVSTSGWLVGAIIGYVISEIIDLGVIQYLVQLLIIGLMSGIITGLGIRMIPRA